MPAQSTYLITGANRGIGRGFVFHPGLVETDLARGVAGGSLERLRQLGSISVETSVASMVESLDKASRDDFGGSFRNHDGTVLPW